MKFKITTLIENNPDDNLKLYNEHGLSLYLEINDIRILFDTGQSGDFVKNAELLNIDLLNLDYVFLSHGHYDHSGGFRAFVDKVKVSYKLIIGKKFFNSKYKCAEGRSYKYNGNSFDEKFVNENNISIKYIEEDMFNINKEIMVFSNFRRSNEFELINKKFKVKQKEGYCQDDFSDEIVLGVKTDKGFVIIVGCSHIGIVNILDTIMERTNMQIYGVVGGTHLVEADEARLNATLSFFKEKNIQVLGLSHCTGEKAIEEIGHQFGKKFIYNNTGNVISLNV
ncbi:MBL fold metallo-hydrolase [Clostridium oryzae]|uniref:ComEC family competence protein n=1 Tax=Clostridium oryzae TaxID=1450648 RepID=A0A1V4IHS9_9CLOT|nr:MBL fold metallo-hydrolase [Clostridium oryzae]OPJ59561.1 ComEC family competence protein [Clostridium oryzae]